MRKNFSNWVPTSNEKMIGKGRKKQERGKLEREEGGVEGMGDIGEIRDIKDIGDIRDIRDISYYVKKALKNKRGLLK